MTAVNILRRVVVRLQRSFAQPTPRGAPSESQDAKLDLSVGRVSLAEAAADTRPTIIFFAPEAGIAPHFVSHCLAARALQERGHRVLIVRCFDVYPRCVVMDGRGLPQDLSPEQRQSVCNDCARTSVEMTAAYGLSVLDLRELVDDAIRQAVDEATRELPEDLSTFTIEGNRLGQICGAEAAVTFKTSDFTGATPHVRALLIQYLRGALLSYRAMQRLIKTINVARVVHFNEYGILLAGALAARQAGIPTTNMSQASLRGVDRRRIVFMSEPLAIESFRRRLKEWPAWREFALPANAVADVADDCIYRMSSNSTMVYSPMRSGSTEDVFSHLRLSDGRRLLVAFTSSLDEIAANNQYLSALSLEPFPEKQPFRDQIEWLEALIAWVEPSPDLQLVIRIHPREDINRRDKVSSRHLEILRERFSRPLRHVRIVWPADPVSSYDLMELADVGLSSWSSTALEMARLGVPVVIAFDRHTPFPIGDVVTWSAEPAGYFRCIDDALRRGPSLEPIKYAYRWTNVRILGCAVDLSDVNSESDFGGLPPYKTPAAAGAIEEILVNGRDALEIARDAMTRAQDGSAARHEREALLRQLRRCIWFLCTGEDRMTDYRLFFGEESPPDLPDGFDAALVASGGAVAFRTRDRVVRRRSRMVQRLAPLAAQNIVVAVPA